MGGTSASGMGMVSVGVPTGPWSVLMANVVSGGMESDGGYVGTGAPCSVKPEGGERAAGR